MHQQVLLPLVEPGQYTSNEMAEYAAAHGLACSVGRTGVCLLTGYSFTRGRFGCDTPVVMCLTWADRVEAFVS